MLSLAEQKKLFTEEFGFEPMIEEPSAVPSVTKPALPDFDAQKKLFAEEFGFEPQIEELPETKPTQTYSNLPKPTEEPKPEPISFGVTRSFEEPEQISTGVTRSFEEPESTTVEGLPERIPLPVQKISDDPEVAKLERGFYDAPNPRSRAFVLKMFPRYKAAELLSTLPENEQALVRYELETLHNEDREKNAFALGILQSTPVPIFSSKETKEAIQKTQEAAPIRFAAGQIAGTIGQAIVGGGAINKLLGKIGPIANSPLLRTALTRITTSGAIAAGQNIGRKDIGEAIGDVVQQSGGGLVSIIPEVLAPPGVAQLIAQPLGDLIYDAVVGNIRGENVGSKEWWKNEIISLASSFGFAIRDVASGKTFRAEQTAQRDELVELLRKKEPVEIEITMPKERSDKLNELIKESLEKAKKPAQSNVIQPESPEFVIEPSRGIEVTRNIRKPPTEEDLKLTIDKGGGKPYIEGYERPIEPQQIPTAAPGEPGRETIPPYAESKPTGAPTGEGLRSEAAESGWTFGDTREEIESVLSETSPQTFDSRIDETVSAEIDRLNYEEMAAPAKPEEPGIIEDNYSKALKEAEQKIKDIEDEWMHEGADRAGIQKEAVEEIAKKYNVDVKKLQKELLWLPVKKREKPVSSKDIEELFQKRGKEPPKFDKYGEQISSELPKRKRGIFSEVGAAGEKSQRKLTDVDTDPETVKVQQILDKQRADVKNKFHKSFKQKIRNTTDFIGEQFVDRVYYAKRLLGKTPEAKNVIGKINAAKGNSAESKMQYEAAEKEISKNLPHHLEHTFEDYLEAKRIKEIEEVKGEGEVKHTGGMGIGEANRIINTIENKYSPEESGSIKTSGDRYWKVMNSQLQQLRDNGLLTNESYDILSTQGKYYSKRKFLQHIDPETTITTPQGKRISVRDSGIQSLGEGSEEAMVNNWRLLLSEVISRTQSRIFKNRASKALADFVNKNPENMIGAKLDSDPTADLPTGMERIFYMENGESKAVLVPQKFAKSWNQNDQALNATTATLLHYGSGSFLVRPLATGALAPEFALTNIPRDIALQWLSTKEYSKIAPVAIFQNIDNIRRVFRDAWSGEGRYRQYVAEGGGMEFLNEQGSFLSKDPTKPMTATTERNRQVLKVFSKLQEFSERLTRLALREQAIKNGKSPEEATRIAREYLDFAQGGSFTKAANNAVPYLNASVQGTRSVTRAFIDDPINTSIKALQLMAMGGALAYTANQFRKDKWDKISDREKVTRWNFPTGMSYTNAAGDKIDTYFSIPKDQSSRIFATIGETAAEMQQGIIDGKTAWNRISMAFDDLSPVDMLGLLPPSISAIMGYALNKDFWLREDIWKGREVSPYMEFYEGKTPEAYIDLADKLKDVGIELSPARLHSSMRQVMPANPVTALMGGAYDQITAQIEGKEKEKLNQSVMERISRMPGARKYFRSTYPSRTDYEKLVKDLKKYRISLYDESGEKKNERTLKREIKEAEIKLGDIRQKFDNEARIISGLFLSKNPEEAQQKWISLRNEAYKKLGRKEVKRIERRIKTWIKKRSGSVYKEAIK